MKTRCVLSLCLFAGYVLNAQTFDRNRVKREDRIILHQSFDDSTRALAGLFIAKRGLNTRPIDQALIKASVSAGLGLLGIPLLDEDGMASTIGVVTVLGGLMFTTYFLAEAGYYSYRNRHFTLRKYRLLIRKYKEGEPLPEFYTSQLIVFQN